MKRVAESQLTKDSVDNEDETLDVTSGFQKADPSILETRPMRGLPRRSLGPASAPTTPSAPPVVVPNPLKETAEPPQESASRFSGFSGFGNRATTSSSPFNVPQLQNNNARPPTAFPAPLSSTSAKGVPSFPSPSNPTPPSTPPLAPDAQKKQDAALKYYRSLRGINSSFLDSAKKAIQTDPLGDIVELLERYKSLRSTAQQEFDGDLKILEKSQKAPTQSATPGPSPTKASTSALRLSSSTASPLPAASGFIPKMDSSAGASPFTFSKPFESTSTSAKPTFGFSPAFGQTNAMSTSASTGGSSPLFGGRVESTTDTKAPPKIDFFTSFKPSTTAAPLTPGLSSFLTPSKPPGAAGDPSTPTPSKPGPSSASPPSPSAFGFGSGKNTGVSHPFVSFGKGSIGNPVGFGFGGSPAVTATSESSDAISENKVPTTSGGAGVDTTPSNAEHEPSPAPSQGSAYDTDGPGEEEESTIHETRARVYKMIPTGGWVNSGTGQLKLKAHNELAKRRILMRNSSTGQVLLNFNLLPGFKVTVDGNTMMFSVPGEDQSATIYRLRLPTETDALKWQEKIHGEVSRLVPSIVT